MTERNDSSTTSNTPYPYLNTERNRPHTHIVSNSNDDNDFLIQTERNMVELNENITRIAHLNEAQVASGSPPLPTNYDRENYRRYQHPFGNVYGGAARGLIGRSSGDSLFYSEHSNNRRTQAMHSNDPCAQQ